MATYDTQLTVVAADGRPLFTIWINGPYGWDWHMACTTQEEAEQSVRTAEYLGQQAVMVAEKEGE